MNYQGDPAFIIARTAFDRMREDYPNTPPLGDHELMLAIENSSVAWQQDFLYAISRIEDAVSELIDMTEEEEDE